MRKSNTREQVKVLRNTLELLLFMLASKYSDEQLENLRQGYRMSMEEAMIKDQREPEEDP